MADLTTQIARELYRTLQILRADGELLATVGSYGDTLDDDDVLRLLRSWNDRHVTTLAPSHQE
jgi:hypothetical protein